MSADVSDRDLEARIEALRRELAGLVVALSTAGRQLDDLTDELRSRRQGDKVVALDQRRHPNGSHGGILARMVHANRCQTKPISRRPGVERGNSYT